jgi:hypothetical protein
LKQCQFALLVQPCDILKSDAVIDGGFFLSFYQPIELIIDLLLTDEEFVVKCSCEHLVLVDQDLRLAQALESIHLRID